MLTMATSIKNQIKLMPKTAGCYQFFDTLGEIIYIGKAKNLFKRVSSYFSRNHSSPKLSVMVPKIAKIECIALDSEVEALILESELIKKYKPRYNILLKDDKKFPYFLITKEDYPRITVVRKANINQAKGRYFGPYTDSRAMWSTLDILGKIFPLKKCKTPKFNSRPCLYYDIGRCLAPCQKRVTPEDYQKMLKEVELFLSGKQMELVEILKREMKEASGKLEFEKAQRFKDSYLDILKTVEKQKIVSENTKLNQDFIGVVKSQGAEKHYCACILEIREGRLVNKKDFSFSYIAVVDDSEVLEAIMREYYTLLSDDKIVKSIVVGNLPQGADVYSSWLSSRANKVVKLSVATKKAEKEILALAQKNAQINLEQLQLKELIKIQNDYNEVGSWIMDKLCLKSFPHHIECFDISHTQGTNTVASKVVFKNGEPKKSLYRKYKLKSLEKGEVDDFKSMREVLSRHFKRIKSGQSARPDLIIIDGGKGQLSSVIKVMKEFELDLNIVSLAKREEEIFLPSLKTPVIFPAKSPALHLFQRVRDEAHRFAVTFHKSLRAKEMLKK